MALIDKKILNPIRYHQDNANTVIGQASTMKALFDQGAEDLTANLLLINRPFMFVFKLIIH